MVFHNRWHVALCILSYLSICLAHYYGPIKSTAYAYNQPWSNYGTKQQYNVGTDSLAISDKMAQVPLLLVQSNRLKLVQGGAIYYQPTYYGIRELPAIRLELQRPMTVSRPATMIEFPSSFTYYHDGHAMPFTVAAVVAPLYAIRGPQEVSVVFAVPSIGVPSYHIQPVRRPVASPSYYPTYQSTYLPPSNNLYTHPTASYHPTNSIYSPSNSYTPSSRPSFHYNPANHYNNAAHPYKPSGKPSAPVNSFTPVSNRPSGNQGSNQGHNRPLVTILDFPSSVSSPSALFFQPPIDSETELGNREPPQAVVPAGIVQSTAPLPNLSVFVNSKESSILQTLRDEAEKNRLALPTTYNVDYDVIIN